MKKFHFQLGSLLKLLRVFFLPGATLHAQRSPPPPPVQGEELTERVCSSGSPLLESQTEEHAELNQENLRVISPLPASHLTEAD